MSTRRAEVPRGTKLYPRRRPTVNPAAWCLLGFALLPSACVAPPAAPTAERRSVSVRYDVEPALLRLASEEARARLDGDFALIARMGFPEVLASFVAESDRAAVLDAARRAGLGVLLTDPRFDHFLRSGVRPAACDDADALVTRCLPPSVRTHAAFVGVSLRVPRGGGESDCVRRLSAALASEGVRVLHLSNDASRPSSEQEAAVISAVIPSADSDESIRERWLANLHDALALGRTGGLVFDRFRAIGGDGPRMIGDAHPPSPATLTAVRQSVDRVRAWAPRLVGLAPTSDTSADRPDRRLTFFCGEKRRYVLVANRSTDRYLRGTVSLPERVADRPVRRAVEVPPAPNPVPGAVYDARGGGVKVTVELRPRDAALFELF